MSLLSANEGHFKFPTWRKRNPLLERWIGYQHSTKKKTGGRTCLRSVVFGQIQASRGRVCLPVSLETQYAWLNVPIFQNHPWNLGRDVPVCVCFAKKTLDSPVLLLLHCGDRVHFFIARWLQILLSDDVVQGVRRAGVCDGRRSSRVDLWRSCLCRLRLLYQLSRVRHVAAAVNCKQLLALVILYSLQVPSILGN